MKHTPGKWVWNKLDFYTRIISSPTIGTVFEIKVDRTDIYDPNETDANARLIAASPDMIEERIKYYDGEDSNGNIVLRIPKEKYVELTERATGMTIDEVLQEARP